VNFIMTALGVVATLNRLKDFLAPAVEAGTAEYGKWQLRIDRLFPHLVPGIGYKRIGLDPPEIDGEHWWALHGDGVAYGSQDEGSPGSAGRTDQSSPSADEQRESNMRASCLLYRDRFETPIARLRGVCLPPQPGQFVERVSFLFPDVRFEVATLTGDTLFEERIFQAGKCRKVTERADYEPIAGKKWFMVEGQLLDPPELTGKSFEEHEDIDRAAAWFYP
jgi:hypothetical protein